MKLKVKLRVLPSTYIPVIDKKQLLVIISRLPKHSLLELIKNWPKSKLTEPFPLEDWTQSQFNNHVLKNITEMSSNRYPKRKVVDKIVYKFWSNGLNLLQLSQLDCQLIVDKPNSFYWIKSTIKDQSSKECSISIDPKKFLQLLTKELSSLYLTHIYICKHPLLPLILIRIQVFDLAIDKASSLKNPHITSNKPYFIAIPMNSPNIIHSPGNTIITKIMLQAFEKCLPQNSFNLLSIHFNDDELPVRSLESMHILNGSSRFSHSLGVWTPYADDTIDMLPLNPVENHSILKEERPKNISDIDDEEEDDDKKLRQLKKIANLRFKGLTDSKYKSSKYFDDNRTRRSRRLIGSADSEDEDIEEIQEDEFASIAPVQMVDFEIKEPIDDQNPKELSSIKLTLVGLDVFAGLHELSVSTIDENLAVVHPSTIPDWLTGQEGAKCGTITNSVFRSHD